MKRCAEQLSTDLHDSESQSSSKSSRTDDYITPNNQGHTFSPDFYRSEIYLRSVIDNIQNPQQAACALFEETTQGHEVVVTALLGRLQGLFHMLPNGSLCWTLQASVNNGTHALTQQLLLDCTPFLFRGQLQRIYDSFRSKGNVDANTDALFQAGLTHLGQRPR